MSDVAIKVENLSKVYKIGAQRSGSLRESLADKWQQVTGKKTEAAQDFWALRDLSFQIKQGEAVGILGKNGAGKSTLLKILSRITEPAKGRIEINGRVASLLEVGTGFHPELSGRENVYLNGTILGMTRREIKAKFDEIIDFSGVEQFIDTPVKYYSSGMYVRLAFAVAAHLEPEILIIDEVLAVGDAEFQKKCLDKMEDVTRNHGRTVLYVSHSLWTVKRLCSVGIVLNRGKLQMIANASEACEYYVNHLGTPVQKVEASHGGSFKIGNDQKHGVVGVRVYCQEVLSSVVYAGKAFRFEVDFRDSRKIQEVVLGFVIRNPLGKAVMGINNRHTGQLLFDVPVSHGTIITEFDYCPLYGEGTYSVDLYFGDSEVNYDVVEDAFRFTLRPADAYESGRELDRSLNEVFFKNINMYGSTVLA